MNIQTTDRVLRGGSWNNKPQRLRSANRNNNTPTNRNNNVGFRVASTPVYGPEFSKLRFAGVWQRVPMCSCPELTGTLVRIVVAGLPDGGGSRRSNLPPSIRERANETD